VKRAHQSKLLTNAPLSREKKWLKQVVSMCSEVSSVENVKKKRRFNLQTYARKKKHRRGSTACANAGFQAPITRTTTSNTGWLECLATTSGGTKP
jgi:hypothetical protein